VTQPPTSNADRLWGESWYFDFASVDGSAGGFVRVGDYPNLGRRWWWAYAVVNSHAVGCALDRPQTGSRDAPWRTTDPSLRMSVEPGPEGWQITVDGDGFELDVRWREQAAAYHYRGGNRLEQPGWAVGTVSVNGQAAAVDGPGQRDHSWGIRDWWRFGWTWCAGWLCDGTRFQATALDARGRIAPDGYILPPDEAPAPVRAVTVRDDSVELDETTLRFTDVAEVSIELTAPDGRTGRLRRALTRVQAAPAPGRGGVGSDPGKPRGGIGWRERNVPGRGLTPRA
jgi:hypothetical protein